MSDISQERVYHVVTEDEEAFEYREFSKAESKYTDLSDSGTPTYLYVQAGETYVMLKEPRRCQ